MRAPSRAGCAPAMGNSASQPELPKVSELFEAAGHARTLQDGETLIEAGRPSEMMYLVRAAAGEVTAWLVKGSHSCEAASFC